jgi:hypothetical protein
MAAKRTTSKKTEPELDPELAAEPEPVEDPTAEDVPLNRAERRARDRGKGARPAQPTSRGKVVGGHGPAHTQRMWSNRRSGG